MLFFLFRSNIFFFRLIFQVSSPLFLQVILYYTKILFYFQCFLFNLYYFRLNVTFVVCFETKKIASCCLVAYLCMVEKHN